MTVMAATAWKTNADLIASCVELGYIDLDQPVLDPTYGRGIWWQQVTPKLLYRSDLRHDGKDFRSLPWHDDMFGTVAYDPPYVCVGGRTTTGIADMHDRFGLTDTPRTPAGLQHLINEGLAECTRVLKPRGHLLVKCQDYVSSGRLFPGTHHTLTFALTLPLELVDRLEHIGHARPQPAGRRQVHARRNLSTLFVFRKART